MQDKKSTGNYSLATSRKLIDELVISEQGIGHRQQRPCDMESVFGNIKYNHHFKRYGLQE